MGEATTPQLPSLEELVIANYLVGTYVSEINDFAERLVRLKGDPETVEEYLKRKESGDTFGPKEPLDRDRLAHVIAFATGRARRCGDHPRVRGKLAGGGVRALPRESTIDEVRHHYRRVREWHLAEAERGVS